MPTSGGPYDPRDYTRHTNSRGINPAAITHRGGSFDPKGFAVEPVSCNAKVAGEATTPIAQAISIQTNCVEQHREYLDHIDAQQNPDPRVPVDQRALAQLDAQRKAFAQTEAAQFATERAPKVAAERAAQAEARLEQSIAAFRQDGDSAQEQRNTRQWESVTRLLDSQTPGEAVATAARLLDNATTAELSVLVEACPPICKARVPNPTGSFRR